MRPEACSLRHHLNILVELISFSPMQAEHTSHPTSFSMHVAQTISTARPPPDPIPTYEPNYPESHYPSELNLFERVWHDRYHFLLQKGLQLRPRYRPGWSPSWLNSKGESLLYEDSLEHPVRSCSMSHIDHESTPLSSYHKLWMLKGLRTVSRFA